MNKESIELTLDRFCQSARLVCNEIEHVDLDHTTELMSALISLLHEAKDLAQCSIESGDDDLEESDTLPEALNRLSDDLEFYVVFDPMDPESICTVGLKDALGDIYKSLKMGLQALDEEPKKKVA